MRELPQGWAEAEIGQVADIETGGTPSKAQPAFFGGPYPFFKPGDLDHGGLLSKAEDTLTDAGLLAARPLPAGSILVTCIGNLGKSGVTALEGATNQQINAVFPTAAADCWYLYYWSRTIRPWLEENSSATTVAIINKGRFSRAPINLAPLAEQRRIVAKLDALTARTARARADLDRIPSLAARYKQAVLAKAFSGELLETGAAWPTKAVGDVIDRVVGGKNLRCEERPPQAGELGVVKVSAVSWGAFNPQASKTLPGNFSPPAHTRIRRGDFLISRANTLELVGAVVVVDEAPENLFLSDKVLRLEMPDSWKRWTMWFLRSPEGRAAIEAGSSGNQLSMRNLSQDALRQIHVPWPEEGIQRQIVGRIERAFAEVDRLSAEAAAARRLLDRLDQAVLARAFRGELVPQDPADEPASVLLDRILAERAAAPKAKRGRKATA